MGRTWRRNDDARPLMRNERVGRWSGVALVLMTGALSCAPTARPTPVARPVDPVTALVGASLWDGTGRAAVPNAVTLVRGDRVLCAGSAGECRVPVNATVVPAAGMWLIPGLIDSHVHLLFLQRGSAGEELGADLRDLLAQGVTTVRDMGTDPEELLSRVAGLRYAPRVHAMQLVAGQRFFSSGRGPTVRARGTVYRQAPALTIRQLGWTPMLFTPGADADSLVAEARHTGAMGLKLYAQLDQASVRALVQAAHRVGLPVWGHAWVQPTSALEQALAGQDGVVHAAGLAGELFSREDRDTLVADGALQDATAAYANRMSAHDPRVLAALDSMARLHTMFEPTLDATRHSVTHYDGLSQHRVGLQEGYVRAAVSFGVEVTRLAVARGVRISAGSDHIAYGPASERASVFGELELLVDSIHLTPARALLAATRDAALAIGGPVAHEVGTIEPGRYADLVLLRQSPLEDVHNLDSVEWVMQGGKLLRPWTLRSGIAMR